MATKFRRRYTPLLILVLPILFSNTVRSLEDTSSRTSVLRRDLNSGKSGIEAVVLPPSKANPVGTKDAPVDGKDGKPHDGPFVETGAERDRKKSKESGGEELATAPLMGTLAGKYTHEDLPVSNDGVMDDPNRLGPKEGTRGTEGGVSGKSKERIAVDKVPDPPKEIPPLPHSEAEEIQVQEGKDTQKPPEEAKKLLEVFYSSYSISTNHLLNICRNQQISLRNLMTFRHQKIQSHMKTS